MPDKQGVSKRSLRTIILILLGVTLFVMLVLFVMENGALPSPGNTSMIFEPTDIATEYDMDNPKIYTAKNEKGIFLATRDSLRFITADGKETILGTYNITAPELVGKGDIVGVAGNGGLSLHVFNTDGALYTAATDHPIAFFSVAANGASVVITPNGDNYDITTYNSKGAVSSYTLYAEANVSPIAADVSDDGRILAVSYLDRNGGEISSKLTFSYINKSEAEDYAAANGVYAAVNSDADSLIGIIRFMKDNLLLALSDRSLACYDANNGAKTKWSMNLGNKLSAICLTESDWFALAYGARNPNVPGEEPGVCRFYDLNGSMLGEYHAAGQITHLAAGHNAALLYSDRYLTAVSQSGNLLWTYEATQDILQASFFENTNKLVLTGSTQTSILRRTRLAPASAAPDELFLPTETLDNADTSTDAPDNTATPTESLGNTDASTETPDNTNASVGNPEEE